MKAGDVAYAVVTNHPDYRNRHWHVTEHGFVNGGDCYEHRGLAQKLADAWNGYGQDKPWFVREVVLLAPGEEPPPEGQMRLL
jgi:hypothetical protein